MVCIAKKLKTVIHARKEGEEDRLWDDLTEEEQRYAANKIADNYLGVLGYERVHKDKTA